MIRTRRLGAVLGALLALAACDESWDVDVFVAVAPAVLPRGSAFEVFVAFGDGYGGFAVFRAGWACGSDPYAATSRFPAPWPAPGGVVGWLVPVDPAGVPFCGPLPVPERVAPAPTPPPTRASATVAPAAVVGCGGSGARTARLDLSAP